MKIESAKPVVLQENPNIILFDGICNLCSAFLIFVYERDKRAIFNFAWIQSNQGKQILNYLGLLTKHYETIVYIENGKTYLKSSAFLKIVKHLRFPWPILWVSIIVPRFLRNWLYDIIARNRYKIFGKKEKCMVPTGELTSRFIQ
jgi:predicted DCC family thiol-disulfide oxidoreductase YuxK